MLYDQVMLRKYNPSSRFVLYGHASASLDDPVNHQYESGVDFEWGQVSATSQPRFLPRRRARFLVVTACFS